MPTLRAVADRAYETAAAWLRPLPIWRLPLGDSDLGEHVSRLAQLLGAGLPDDRVVEIPFGRRMILPRGYRASQRLLDGIYEPGVTAYLMQWLVAGATFVDVGANLGYFSLLASKLVDPGRVIAVESDPFWAAVLARSIELNGATNVELVPLAASDREGELSFFPDHVGGGGSIVRVHGGTPVRVRTRTLDDILAEHGNARPSIVKIDVEGAEAMVLAGMQRTCAESPDLRLIVEFFPRRLAAAGTAPEELLTGLRGRGFVTLSVISDDGIERVGPMSPAEFTHAIGRRWVNLLCER